MRFRNLFLLSALSAAGAGGAQALAQASPGGILPAVPTTRVLAIGHVTAAGTRAALRGIIGTEVRETVKLYLGGKIDQWYTRQDKTGVVFVMNVTSVEEAHALLEKLPMGQQKIMEFDLIPLGPLTPLSVLLRDPSSPAVPPTSGAK